MDLNTLDLAQSAETAFVFELVHPLTGIGIGAQISVKGADSDTYREMLNNLMRAQKARVKRDPKYQPSPEEIEAGGIRLLVAATVGWTGVELDGQTLPFSKENATKLYTRFAWIREQVDATVQDRSNFLQSAQTA